MTDTTIKAGYWKRLQPYTTLADLKRLLMRVDDMKLTDKVILKVGAVPLARYENYNEKQQLELYRDIKGALVAIQGGR